MHKVHFLWTQVHK